MVLALGPGKFYGSGLPRPRIYTVMKLSAERVDPPVSVMDPLMSWAEEAHWSMGGLSFKRHRLQGRIEGNVKKLRSEREKHFKDSKAGVDVDGSETKTPSPPPAPVALKRRRRFIGLVDEESDGEDDEREFKRTARKLGDDFDRVADKKVKTPVKDGAAEVVGLRTRSRRSEEEIVSDKEVKMKIVKEKNSGGKMGNLASKGLRSSPRFAKRM